MTGDWPLRTDDIDECEIDAAVCMKYTEWLHLLNELEHSYHDIERVSRFYE